MTTARGVRFIRVEGSATQKKSGRWQQIATAEKKKRETTTTTSDDTWIYSVYLRTGLINKSAFDVKRTSSTVACRIFEPNPSNNVDAACILFQSYYRPNKIYTVYRITHLIPICCLRKADIATKDYGTLIVT